jgi:Xaa-Pro aminopeptidase
MQNYQNLYQMLSKAKVELLRNIMSDASIDFWVIPSADPHQSEYVAPRWEGRAWISEFTGSAGTVVVTQKHAGLWTDSRYFIQAEQQLDNSIWTLHKMLDSTSQGYIDWIVENVDDGQTIGMNGFTFSSKTIESLNKKIKRKGAHLHTGEDLLVEVWDNRPGLPMSKVIDLSETYTGESRQSKIAQLISFADANNLDHYLLSSLDDIAWLLNIRSNDIAFNPVVLCYLLYTNSKCELFISEGKLSDQLIADFNREGIILKDYKDLPSRLTDINKGVFGLNMSSVSYNIKECVQTKIVEVNDFTTLAKAVKNETEIGHIRNAMKKDGVALLRSIMELEQTVAEGSTSEYDFAKTIIKHRSQQANYFGESFNAIVGYQGNGAIVHYKPEKDTAAQIENKGWLLLDCGAQYFDGTTDITRCFSFTPPTEEQKEAYTLVLKGHIQLAMAKFPVGTVGRQLDILARQALWNHGKDYGHGTGHGVGFFLNVHEAPQGFAAARSPRNEIPLQAGMLTSNEPGYYLENEFGIRIENLVLCVNSEYDGFLEFETVTLFPIDTPMINYSLLTKTEVNWLNAYNQRVYNELSSLVTEDEQAWLKRRCQAV